MSDSELFGLTALGVLVATLLLGVGAGYIERPRLRYAVLVLLAFAPVLVILIHGFSIGCVPGGDGGEKCFGTGFGVVLFTMYAPVFFVVLLAGMWVSRLVRRRR